MRRVECMKQGKGINSTNMLLLYGIKHSTDNNNYVTRRRRFTGKISQYLCKSPINLWLRLNPNSLQSTHVNILETNFDDKLVSKRKLFNNYPPTMEWIYICNLPAGRYVWRKTVTSGVKMLSEAPEASIFTPEVTVIHHADRPKPANNMFIFFLQ